MKRILFLFALSIFLFGCSNKSKFIVNGIIKDTKGKYIYLNRLDVDIPVLIDSAKINRKGIFHMKVKAADADFYQLGVSSTNFITLLAEPKEKISLVFNNKNLF